MQYYIKDFKCHTDVVEFLNKHKISPVNVVSLTVSQDNWRCVHTLVYYGEEYDD